MEDTKRVIDCPRCSGRGSGTWRPDSGICYRCRGKGSVTIDLAASLAALRHARVEWKRVKANLDACTDPVEREWIAECLVLAEERGLKIREGLELAGCPAEYIKQGFWPRKAA